MENADFYRRERNEFAAICLILIIGIVFYGVMGNSGDSAVHISKQTANDICKKITGNETQQFKSYGFNGNLVCEMPSYDSTQNIIIKTNADN